MNLLQLQQRLTVTPAVDEALYSEDEVQMYPVPSVSDPPTFPPVITGYGGESLYQGATRDITCTVTGGNPPVAGVTFTCGGQGQEVSGTSRTITVTADRSNHGSTCTCRARWKTYNPGWYTQTADVTLTVFCEYAGVTVSVWLRSTDCMKERM